MLQVLSKQEANFVQTSSIYYRGFRKIRRKERKNGQVFLRLIVCFKLFCGARAKYLNILLKVDLSRECSILFNEMAQAKSFVVGVQNLPLGTCNFILTR